MLLGLLRLVPSTFANHVAHVLGLRTQKQVGRITARRIIAVVADEQAVRDGAALHLIGDAVGKNGAPIDADNTVAPGVRVARPGPAISGGALPINPRPKQIFGIAKSSSFSVMPQDKSCGLALHMTLPSARLYGNRSRQAASTITQFGGIKYNIHASASIQVLADPRPVLAGAGASCAYYSTLRGRYAG